MIEGLIYAGLDAAVQAIALAWSSRMTINMAAAIGAAIPIFLLVDSAISLMRSRIAAKVLPCKRFNLETKDWLPANCADTLSMYPWYFL